MTMFVELKCPKCGGELKHGVSDEYRCKNCKALFERAVREPTVQPHPQVVPWRPFNPYAPDIGTPYWPDWKPVTLSPSVDIASVTYNSDGQVWFDTYHDDGSIRIY